MEKHDKERVTAYYSRTNYNKGRDIDVTRNLSCMKSATILFYQGSQTSTKPTTKQCPQLTLHQGLVQHPIKNKKVWYYTRPILQVTRTSTAMTAAHLLHPIIAAPCCCSGALGFATEPLLQSCNDKSVQINLKDNESLARAPQESKGSSHWLKNREPIAPRKLNAVLVS